MSTAAAPEPDHADTRQSPTRRRRCGRQHALIARRTKSAEPTQGARIGYDPYDDPTQGRQLGSRPYDDPTQGLQLGSDPDDDPTQGRQIGRPSSR